jgi:hypothetical protein
MICPHCKANLAGGSIWHHFYNEFRTIGYWMDENGNYIETRRILDPSDAAVAADKVAEAYGATQENGKCWGRQIYCKDYAPDGSKIRYYKCPDCNGEW